MARIDLPPGVGEERDRMWAMRPEFAAAADAFSRIIQDSTILPVREHEAARIRIAHINGCEICMEARVAGMEAFRLDEAFYADVNDPARRSRFTRREGLAVEFAGRFAAGAAAFDDAFWTEMRTAFSAAEIVDLAASCAKWLGLGRINAVLGLTATCPARIAPPQPVKVGAA